MNESEHGGDHDGHESESRKRNSPGSNQENSKHDHGHAHDDHEHGHARGLIGFAKSIFAPHSHDAAGKVDKALEASADGMRALKVSLVILLITALFQVIVVLASRSVALLADTTHNFADALTAIPLGIAFIIGRRPPTKRYTHGYGRAEDLAGLFILLVIAASAAVAAIQAINRLIHPHDVHHVGWVVVAGIVGFLGNETAAVYRIRVGKRIGSAALVADGMHARTDGLTSLAVVFGAIGVGLGWRLADPIIGLFITVAILVVLKGAARDIYRRLMDSVDEDLVDQIAGVLTDVPGVIGVDSVRVRWVGHELRAEADITSGGSLTLIAAHDISEEAHHALLHAVPRLASAVIHSSPASTGEVDYHARTAPHFADRSAQAK